MLTFRERENIRKMKESQINPEAKGYIYEYNVTSEGAEVKKKMNKYPSHGCIRGSTIMEAIPIPRLSSSPSKEEGSSPLLKHRPANLSNSIIEENTHNFVPVNQNSQKVRREYYGNAPLPMAMQQNKILQSYSGSPYVSRVNLQNSPRNIEVDQRFVTPVKAIHDQKELPTTAIRETPFQEDERSEYKYEVKHENEEANTGCGFCRGG